MRARARPVLSAIVLAGLWGGMLGFLNLHAGVWLLDRIEATMTDLRMQARGVRVAPDLVAVVAIDDEAVQAIGAYPIPRVTLARLIETIGGLGPKAIAVDMLLVDAGSEAGDGALEHALSMTPSVIAAAGVFSRETQTVGSEGPLAGIPVAGRLLLPLKRFSDAAAVAVVNVATDRSGTPRSVPMLSRTAARIEASLPLRAAMIALRTEPVIEAGRIAVGGRTIRTDTGHSLPLAFYGSRGAITTISAAKVLSGGPDAKSLAGRVVVIGATVTGGGDVFPTPFDPVLPGVEVIATAISHILAGDGLVRDRKTRLLDGAVAIALPVAIVGLLAWRRSAIGFASIAVTIALVAGGNFLAFDQGVWLSLALPVAAAGPPAILFGAAQMWLGRRRANEFANQSALLQRIQAPGLSRWLARDKDFLSKPVSQNAAVVFVDLSGFTGLSETLGPDETRELINTFYGQVAEDVEHVGGMITSFMGDGVMILFGPPEPGPADAANAARCCVQLTLRTASWLKSLPGDVGSRIGFKIGAHFGVVVTSRLGRGDNQQIATTGDTVNVAARLMEVAASSHVPVAVSDALLAAAGREPFGSGTLSGPLDTAIRGRSGSLAVWLWSDAAAQP